jgi:predicted DNA binding CopG/RHH family protein
MKAKDLDKIFDDGDVDFTEHLDLSKAFKPGQEQKRVNVDFPIWMLERIDKEAGRLGVPRQSLIKVWIGEKLEKKVPKKVAKKKLLKRPARKRTKTLVKKG